MQISTGARIAAGVAAALGTAGFFLDRALTSGGQPHVPQPGPHVLEPGPLNRKSVVLPGHSAAPSSSIDLPGPMTDVSTGASFFT